jgi:hypothetical protein
LLHRNDDRRPNPITRPGMSLPGTATTVTLVICSHCRRERPDPGDWGPAAGGPRGPGVFETHGLCPPCLALLYPELAEADAETVREGVWPVPDAVRRST